MRNGQGTYTTKNGSSYEGWWLNDMKHGKGRYLYNLSGECYFGEW